MASNRQKTKRNFARKLTILLTTLLHHAPPSLMPCDETMCGLTPCNTTHSLDSLRKSLDSSLDSGFPLLLENCCHNRVRGTYVMSLLRGTYLLLLLLSLFLVVAFRLRPQTCQTGTCQPVNLVTCQPVNLSTSNL